MKTKIEIPVGNWKQRSFAGIALDFSPRDEARKAAKGGYHCLRNWARKRGFKMRAARELAEL
jgi:hypothetical protein